MNLYFDSVLQFTVLCVNTKEEKSIRDEMHNPSYFRLCLRKTSVKS